MSAQARKSRAARAAPADHPWVKCPGCQEILFRKEIERKLNVCPKCGHHLRLTVDQRLLLLADRGSFEETDAAMTAADPLGFCDSVPYPERVGEARARTGKKEALLTGFCTIEGRRVALGLFDFGFLGGSMGSVVGEKLARLGERALAEQTPLVVVAASGGARMQEGILSLMQMAKVSAVLGRLRDQGVPYISVLTDPTTGGVAASLAMLGDLNVAEPGALIGFAGPRVIEQTIGHTLPEGFQTSEFLLAHGMVDLVVERRTLKATLARLLAWMDRQRPHSTTSKVSKVKNVPARAMTYAETLSWLYHLEVSRGWDLKLESVRAALERLGSPEQSFPSLHIAGTNGKGSTAAIAHAVLAAHGLRVGLFTSPHLSDFRERVRIGDEWITESRVVELVEEIRARLFEPDVELTFFEVTTVLAFLHFARARVDAAVVEVGLGGRLDATNVLVPRTTVVTTIGFDHERYLGTTIPSIAAEKGGIFKPGVPAIVGRVDREAETVLAQIAAAQPCPYHLYGREFRAEIAADGFDYHGRRTIRDLRPGLAGRFQIDNAAVALAALEEGDWLGEIADETIRAAVATVRWPGRLEVIREHPRVVLDGAHNPAGVTALVGELPRLAGGRPIHLVFGVLADKRWSEMVERLARAVADVAVVPVVERRSENPARVAGLFRRFVPTRIEQSATTAIERLLADPASADHVILVAGSLFLVGEARRHFEPPTPS